MSRFLRVTPRLPVADLNRTMDFYRNRLGFSAAVVWPQDKPVFCILDRDQTSLGFYVPEAGQDAGLPGAGEFYIDVEDVAGLHRQLESSVTVEWGPEVYFYGRREFAVRDPDGYLVIFTEKTDDPPTCLDQ